MARKIHISSTPEGVAHDFAEFFASWLKEKAIVTVALSGGSTPRVLFEHWAEEYKDSIDWSKVHFFWGDERCVPPDDEESNYKMAHELFLSKVDIPEENIHRIKGEAEPVEEARRYAEELLRYVSSRNGFPSFDMVIQGMGEDGHTASIFPDQMELLLTPALCAVAVHPETGQQRITLTGKVLNNATEVVFLVTGKNKAERVEDILGGGGKAREYPAAHIRPEEGGLHWFLDKAAAAKVE